MDAGYALHVDVCASQKQELSGKSGRKNEMCEGSEQTWHANFNASQNIAQGASQYEHLEPHFP